MSKIYCGYKSNGVFKKGKHTGRVRTISKPQDRKIKAIYLKIENIE